MLTSIDLNSFEVGDGIMEGGPARFLVVDLGVNQGSNLLLLDVLPLSELLDEVVLGLDDVVDTLSKVLVLGLVDFVCNAKLFFLRIIHRPLFMSRLNDIPCGIMIRMSSRASHHKLCGGAGSYRRG